MFEGSWMYKIFNNYESDFSFLNDNESFPTERIKYKNAEYRFRKKEYSGKYGFNRYLTVLVDKTHKDIPYQRIGLNYFRLMTNKLVDLIMNNEVVIKTGNNSNDIELNKIIDRVEWLGSIREALKFVTIYGDVYIKTYKDGASVFAPNRAFKVVDANNINNTKAYVLYTPIYKNNKISEGIEFIRFEIHQNGKIFEIVKRYTGGITAGRIGSSVAYNINGRKIPVGGVWYDTGVSDCSMVQCLSINKDADSIYGESIYQDIQSLVFALEQRISLEHYALNNLVEPLLIVGMSSIEQTENGEYRLKTVNGNMLVTEDRNSDNNIIPQQFQQEYNLESYEQFIDTIKSELYELSEMGKIFLTSEYSGNISEESISNLIKGAIDKANRILSEVYYGIRNSLYVLAITNGLDIKISDITIDFNIGQTDNDATIAEVCKTLNESGILSKSTLRQRYFGYTQEQSDNEQLLIDQENGQNNNISKEMEETYENY